MTYHVTKLAGTLGLDRVDPLDADFHARAQPRPEPLPDALFRRRRKIGSGYDLDPHPLPRLLHDLERRNSLQVAQDVDQRETVHDGAVGGDDEIGASALDLLQQRQAAPACACAPGQDADVAGPVAQEREVARRKMRDHDLARLAVGHRRAAGADDLDHHVLGADVHAALRALVRDKAGVAAPVTIRHPAAERLADQLALVVVEHFRGDEDHANAEVVQPLPASRGVRGDPGEGRWISEHHARPPGPDFGHETVEVGRRHVERGQERGTQQTITQQAHPILRAQLDRRAPQHDLGVADVHTPPAGRAPFRRDVVARASFADVKHQGLAAGSSGIVATQRGRIVGLERVGVGAYQGLGQQRQAGKIAQRAHGGRIEFRLVECPAIIRHVPMDVGEKPPQAIDAQCVQVGPRPPLARLEFAQALDARMPLDSFMQRKEPSGNEASPRILARSHVAQGCSAARPSARA
jgi:hypothetical protein